jgi:hypothetical protein
MIGAEVSTLFWPLFCVFLVRAVLACGVAGGDFCPDKGLDGVFGMRLDSAVMIPGRAIH